MDNNLNPLLQYSRRAELYVRLPSQGYFNDPNDVQLSAEGEVAVSPMTTNDELLLKSPDGLLNGESVIKIIESCCPDIKNVRDLPNPDLDVLLMAIRRASYGDEMEFHVDCPKCKTEGTFVYSLDAALSTVKNLDPEYFVALSSNLTVFIRPYTVESAIADAMFKYKEGRTMQEMVGEDFETNVKKQKEVTKKIHEIADNSMLLTSKSIIKITDPNGDEMDVNADQILAWLKTLSRSDAVKITKLIEQVNAAVIEKTQTLTCQHCDNEWESGVNFDPSYFFGASS